MTELYKAVNDRYWKVKSQIRLAKEEVNRLDVKISVLNEELDALEDILTDHGEHIYECFREKQPE